MKFPVKGFDPSKWVLLPGNDEDEIFDLYAVVNHMGNFTGGHYTVYVRAWDPANAETGKFLIFLFSFLNS